MDTVARVRELAAQRGLSLAELSRLCGVPYSTLRNTEYRGGQLILVDLNSTYGTYIHGKRIPANTPVALKSGSSFCLGSEKCRFTVC